MLKKVNFKTIQNFSCLEISSYVPVDWDEDANSVLDLNNVPLEYRLFTVLRNEFLSEAILDEFSIICLKDLLTILPSVDEEALLVLGEKRDFSPLLKKIKELRAHEIPDHVKINIYQALLKLNETKIINCSNKENENIRYTSAYVISQQSALLKSAFKDTLQKELEWQISELKKLLQL